MTDNPVRQEPHTPSQDIDHLIFSGQTDRYISQR